MIILYTVIEGGHWIPFNTPMDEESLKKRLGECCVFHVEVDPIKCHASESVRLTEYGDHICIRPWDRIHGSTGGNIFVPQDDSLPEFHSILTETNHRWDAMNQEWFQFSNKSLSSPVVINGQPYGNFRQWFDGYVRNWRPGEDDDERELGWRDAMHPGEELKKAIYDSRFQKSSR